MRILIGFLEKKQSIFNVFQKMNPIVGRLVPLAAVAAANCINIPLMRRQELQKGITLVDDNYNSLNVESKKAAVQGISAVIASRIAMATPGMGKSTIIAMLPAINP